MFSSSAGFFRWRLCSRGLGRLRC